MRKIKVAFHHSDYSGPTGYFNEIQEAAKWYQLEMSKNNWDSYHVDVVEELSPEEEMIFNQVAQETRNEVSDIYQEKKRLEALHEQEDSRHKRREIQKEISRIDNWLSGEHLGEIYEYGD